MKTRDIVTTAEAYAKAAYDFFGADCVTLSPYLGYDRISPIIKGYPDKGCYILKRHRISTGEIQMWSKTWTVLSSRIKKKYECHQPRMVRWSALPPEELKKLPVCFQHRGKRYYFDSGSWEQAAAQRKWSKSLRRNQNLKIHRINSQAPKTTLIGLSGVFIRRCRVRH
jgi:hypothetical protein